MSTPASPSEATRAPSVADLPLDLMPPGPVGERRGSVGGRGSVGDRRGGSAVALLAPPATTSVAVASEAALLAPRSSHHLLSPPAPPEAPPLILAPNAQGQVLVVVRNGEKPSALVRVSRSLFLRAVSDKDGFETAYAKLVLSLVCVVWGIADAAFGVFWAIDLTVNGLSSGRLLACIAAFVQVFGVLLPAHVFATHTKTCPSALVYGVFGLTGATLVLRGVGVPGFAVGEGFIALGVFAALLLLPAYGVFIAVLGAWWGLLRYDSWTRDIFNLSVPLRGSTTYRGEVAGHTAWGWMTVVMIIAAAAVRAAEHRRAAAASTSLSSFLFQSAAFMKRYDTAAVAAALDRHARESPHDADLLAALADTCATLDSFQSYIPNWILNRTKEDAEEEAMELSSFHATTNDENNEDTLSHSQSQSQSMGRVASFSSSVLSLRGGPNAAGGGSGGGGANGADSGVFPVRRGSSSGSGSPKSTSAQMAAFGVGVGVGGVRDMLYRKQSSNMASSIATADGAAAMGSWRSGPHSANAAVRPRKVTLLSVNYRVSVPEHMNAFVSLMYTTASATRGAIHTAVGNRVLVSWNGVQKVAQPEVACAGFVEKLAKWRRQNEAMAAELCISAAAFTGDAVVLLAGSRRHRMHTIDAPFASALEAMARYARTYEEFVMCSATASVASYTYDLRCIDAIKLAAWQPLPTGSEGDPLTPGVKPLSNAAAPQPKRVMPATSPVLSAANSASSSSALAATLVSEKDKTSGVGEGSPPAFPSSSQWSPTPASLIPVAVMPRTECVLDSPYYVERVFEFVCMKKPLDGEWMYQVQERSSNDVVTDAMAACLEGRYTDAETLLLGVLDDPPARTGAGTSPPTTAARAPPTTLPMVPEMASVASSPDSDALLPGMVAGAVPPLPLLAPLVVNFVVTETSVPSPKARPDHGSVARLRARVRQLAAQQQHSHSAVIEFPLLWDYAPPNNTHADWRLNQRMGMSLAVDPRRPADGNGKEFSPRRTKPGE